MTTTPRIAACDHLWRVTKNAGTADRVWGCSRCGVEVAGPMLNLDETYPPPEPVAVPRNLFDELVEMLNWNPRYDGQVDKAAEAIVDAVEGGSDWDWRRKDGAKPPPPPVTVPRDKLDALREAMQYRWSNETQDARIDPGNLMSACDALLASVEAASVGTGEQP